MIRVNDLTTFSVTQQLDYQLWGYDSEDITGSNDTELNFKYALGAASSKKEDDNGELAEMIIKHLVYLLESSNNGWEVEEAYGIIHNKDTREVWSETLMRLVIEVKACHIHASFKFKKGANKGANIDSIARVLGLEPQYIEKPKPGRYSWDNQLAYLVHAKDNDKYQYNPDCVATLRGRNYRAIYEESIEKWRKGGLKKEKKQSKEDIDWFENMILRGKITRSQVLLTDEYYKLYAMYKGRIDDAFEVYAQRKMYKALESLQNGEFKTSVIYITGKAGAGKTRFANSLAQDLITKAKNEKGEDWTICQTASTNPVDDYQGEEILIMDDVRGTTMRADDWLKLLDPYNISPSSARYRNKVVVARVIIITATISPVEFFYYSKGVGMGSMQREAVDQFIRRLMSYLHVIDFDDIVHVKPRKIDSSEPRKKYFIGSDSVYSEYDIKDVYNRGAADEIIDELTGEILDNNNLLETDSYDSYIF